MKIKGVGKLTDGVRPGLARGYRHIPLYTTKDKDMDVSIAVSIVSFVLAPVVTIFGFMLRRAFMKLEQTMTETEVRLLVKDRLDPIYVQQRNVQHEINRIERKLDKILDLLVDERRSK